MSALPYRRHVGAFFSEGARLLWREPKTRQVLATELGIHPGTLTRLLYGDARPSLDLALTIASKLTIPMEDWTRKPTAAFELPGAARRRKRLARAARLARKKTAKP